MPADNRIAMAYGPPGVSGVSTIMGIGALPELPDLSEPTMDVDEALGKAVWAAAAVFGIGLVANKPMWRGAGIGGLAVALGVKYLTKR